MTSALCPSRFARPLVLVALFLGTTAGATSNFPSAIRTATAMENTPPCILCHATAIGGRGTATQPFAETLRQHGLTGAFDTESLQTALGGVKEDRSDTDGDGTGDWDELAAGRNPNVASSNGSSDLFFGSTTDGGTPGVVPLDAPPIQYGLGCTAASAPSTLALLGAPVLVFRGRRRRRRLAVTSLLLVLLCACSQGSSSRSPDGGAPTGPTPGPVDGGLGADLDPSELDPASHGGTLTFESIGAPGWYPSRRDPATGPCDAYQSSGCCLSKHHIEGNALTPWDEDLIVTLRGPMKVKQFAVYQPEGDSKGPWNLVSSWDARSPKSPQGLHFEGNSTETKGFDGVIGTECLVDVSTSEDFTCGPGSEPYCPPQGSGKKKAWGWSGSKLFVMLATMPHAGSLGQACSQGSNGNWFDAPWVGLSHGELVRAGAFGGCHCYAKEPDKWYLGDGCGQFNVFEVVNDNNDFRNLDVFSTNMFGYAGYVGEGPCGAKCNVGSLGGEADLIDKATSAEAARGAVASPTRGPGAALRRPVSGYRYFLILLDVPSRTVQLALIHPLNVPATVGALLPGLPARMDASTVEAVRTLRLPR